MTKEYADKKNCWSPSSPKGENNSLSQLPQLKSIYIEEKEKRNFLELFVDKCEKELCDNLKKNSIPK